MTSTHTGLRYGILMCGLTLDISVRNLRFSVSLWHDLLHECLPVAFRLYMADTLAVTCFGILSDRKVSLWISFVRQHRF